jgi:hypothetical protein
MILRRLALFVGLSFAFLTSQLPEYAQQYRQRLGGAIDEINRMLAEFDSDAGHLKMNREQGVARLGANPDEFVRQRAARVREDSARAVRLQRQLAAFETAGPLARLQVLATEFDPAIAARAWSAYEPAVPVTGEGATLAGAGFLTGWGLLRFLGTRRRKPLSPVRKMQA